VALSAVAAVLIFKARWDIPAVLGVTSALALAIRMTGI
jgi:hypothetical protein